MCKVLPGYIIIQSKTPISIHGAVSHGASVCWCGWKGGGLGMGTVGL